MKGDYLYCPNCGLKLELEEVKDEGLIPYCKNCNEYHFPHFNVAISMIVRFKEEVLFIKQYGKDFYILVAGYLKRGESAEEAAIRELKEETNLDVSRLKILKTKYFSKTNTLMINILVDVTNKDVKLNYEVDGYKWFNYIDGLNNIKEGSLAKEFYLNFYNNYR